LGCTMPCSVVAKGEPILKSIDIVIVVCVCRRDYESVWRGRDVKKGSAGTKGVAITGRTTALLYRLAAERMAERVFVLLLDVKGL
jgi:hypothetical protein